MQDHPNPIDEQCFPFEDMVNASELRGFLYCERAWFLSMKGLRLSAEAQSQRNAGIQFHEVRAKAANGGRSPKAFWVPVILAVAGIALLIMEAWRGR
jgi:hypothetical protein